MENIIEVIKPYLLDRPVLSLALVLVFCVAKLKYDEIKSDFDEVRGWLKRIEGKFDGAIDELKEMTREGLKEERSYRHDVEMKQDDRIHEMQKEIGDIREKIGGKE